MKTNDFSSFDLVSVTRCLTSFKLGCDINGIYVGTVMCILYFFSKKLAAGAWNSHVAI